MTASVSSEASDSFALGLDFRYARICSWCSGRVAICQPAAISRNCRPLLRASYSATRSTSTRSMASRSTLMTSAIVLALTGSSATKIIASAIALSSAAPISRWPSISSLGDNSSTSTADSALVAFAALLMITLTHCPSPIPPFQRLEIFLCHPHPGRCPGCSIAPFSASYRMSFRAGRPGHDCAESFALDQRDLTHSHQLEHRQKRYDQLAPRFRSLKKRHQVHLARRSHHVAQAIDHLGHADFLALDFQKDFFLMARENLLKYAQQIE